MKFSRLAFVSLLPQLAPAADSAYYTSTNALSVPPVMPLNLKNPARQRRLSRQSNSAPNSNSWYTLTTLEAGESNCLFALLGVDGSVPYPVRFEPCNPLKDDALWQFVPDSDARYFIYNKAWGGTGQRLDINCQTPSMCIMWMGPSDDIYNNQRWFLDQGGATSQISSLGLPGSSMVSMALNGGYVSLMQNTSASADNALEWKLVKDPAMSSSNSPTSTASTPTPTTVLSSGATATIAPPSNSPTSTASTPIPTAVLSSGATATIAPPTTTTTTTALQPTDSSSKSSPPSTFSTFTTLTAPPSTSTPSPSSPPTNSTSLPDNRKNRTLSAGEIAGIVSAICAVLSIFAIIVPARMLRCITCGHRPRRRVNDRDMRRTILDYPLNIIQTVVNFHGPNRDAAGAAVPERPLLNV